jgi:hypothetical protein
LNKIENYREALQLEKTWDAYLLAESGLPGRRANIELAKAVALEGDRHLFERYIAFNPQIAPANSSEEFLAFCGVLGLGSLLAAGDRSLLSRLREHANDPRWRLREAVAMALQQWGRQNMDLLLQEMAHWTQGTLLERRAAAAAVCEPDLLVKARHAEGALLLLDAIMESLASVQERNSEAFKALRKGLSYCWSVAVVAQPQLGKPLFEKWLHHSDPDIVWIMKQNLKKSRMARMDPEWALGRLADN